MGNRGRTRRPDIPYVVPYTLLQYRRTRLYGLQTSYKSPILGRFTPRTRITVRTSANFIYARPHSLSQLPGRSRLILGGTNLT